MKGALEGWRVFWQGRGGFIAKGYKLWFYLHTSLVRQKGISQYLLYQRTLYVNRHITRMQTM